ncbi:MAG: HD domain-containing phosphohydrolase [Victivallales bacterium]
MRQERLVGISGPLVGKTFPVNGTFSIGRSSENTLHLDDSQVSRHHAVLEQLSNCTILRDLGSGNGTFVDGRKVAEHRLNSGEVIRIGGSRLRFETVPVPSLKASAPPLPITSTRRGIVPALMHPVKAEMNVAVGNVRYEQKHEGVLKALTVADFGETIFQQPARESSKQQLIDLQKRLAAVYNANQIISSENDLNKLFERVMEQIFALVPAHNGVIILKDEDTGEPLTVFVKTGSGNSEVVISSTIVSRALEKCEALISMNAAEDERFDGGMSIMAQRIASVMCAPLIHQNEVLGAVYVDTRGATSAFVQNDLELLVALAGPAAIAIRNAQYMRKLERSYHDTIVALSNSVEARDHYTVGHTWRVTNFALQMAKAMGWTEEQLKTCEIGGVLHDVGKIAIEDSILCNPGRLTDEEFAKMKVHPEKGARMMRDIPFLKSVIPYCLYHHERYDGHGYPFQMSGDKIPIEGRLIAVADTFDAMTSNRPYRKGLDPELAVAELEKGKGTQFDPECVDALVRCYREGKISSIMQDYMKDARSAACPFCSTYIKIPEVAAINTVLICDVCKRRVRLNERNEALFLELA